MKTTTFLILSAAVAWIAHYGLRGWEGYVTLAIAVVATAISTRACLRTWQRENNVIDAAWRELERSR